MISFNFERVRVAEDGGKHGDYVHYADAMQEIKDRDERIETLEGALTKIANDFVPDAGQEALAISEIRECANAALAGGKDVLGK